MEPAAYEAYHFHLLYDAVLSVAGFVVVLVTCRRLALHDPELRVRLFALAIGLPVLGELVAFAAYQVRPAPHTPVGQAILRFHEQCGSALSWTSRRFWAHNPVGCCPRCCW